jgi:hypothetical protein
MPMSGNLGNGRARLMKWGAALDPGKLHLPPSLGEQLRAAHVERAELQMRGRDIRSLGSIGCVELGARPCDVKVLVFGGQHQHSPDDWSVVPDAGVRIASRRDQVRQLFLVAQTSSRANSIHPPICCSECSIVFPEVLLAFGMVRLPSSAHAEI